MPRNEQNLMLELWRSRIGAVNSGASDDIDNVQLTNSPDHESSSHIKKLEKLIKKRL